MEEERYETLKELGSGNFGVARLAKDKKTEELVAIKYIERGKKVMKFYDETFDDSVFSFSNLNLTHSDFSSALHSQFDL